MNLVGCVRYCFGDGGRHFGLSRWKFFEVCVQIKGGLNSVACYVYLDLRAKVDLTEIAWIRTDFVSDASSVTIVDGFPRMASEYLN